MFPMDTVEIDLVLCEFNCDTVQPAPPYIPPPPEPESEEDYDGIFEEGEWELDEVESEPEPVTIEGIMTNDAPYLEPVPPSYIEW